MLFTRDNIPLESSSLAILVILIAGFQLVPYEKAGEVVLGPIDFFAGFGNEALIAICALMMVGKALETTGPAPVWNTSSSSLKSSCPCCRNRYASAGRGARPCAPTMSPQLAFLLTAFMGIAKLPFTFKRGIRCSVPVALTTIVKAPDSAGTAAPRWLWKSHALLVARPILGTRNSATSNGIQGSHRALRSHEMRRLDSRPHPRGGDRHRPQAEGR